MQKFRVDVRGTFGGSVGNWRPGITGTLNQTGGTDEEASTVGTADEASELFDLIVEAGARAEDVRIVDFDE